jgi:hypothetical protein
MVRVVYLLLALEVILGGGGRLMEIGPITLRMVLFAVALVLTVMTVVARGKLVDAKATMLLLISFLLVQSAGVVIGLSRGNPPEAVWADVQPLLFWLAAPFVALAAEDRRNVYATRGMIMGAGIAMALGYLGVLFMLVIGRIDLAWLYETVDATGEFSFRQGNLFVYKGFFYLGVCVVFLVAMPGRHVRLLLLLTGVALILTLTRSFIISTAIAVVLLLYVLRMRALAMLTTVGGAAAVVVLYSSLLGGADEVLGDRAMSNAVRIEDMSYIFTNVNPLSLLFGNGYGTPVADRLNIENAFLWIVWKTGMAGLAFWLAPIVMCILAFSRISRRDPNFRLACALLCSIVLIYVQSAMNPYLNNPIGLLFVMIAIFGLRSLSRREQGPVVAARVGAVGRIGGDQFSGSAGPSQNWS